MSGLLLLCSLFIESSLALELLMSFIFLFLYPNRIINLVHFRSLLLPDCLNRNPLLCFLWFWCFLSFFGASRWFARCKFICSSASLQNFRNPQGCAITFSCIFVWAHLTSLSQTLCMFCRNQFGRMQIYSCCNLFGHLRSFSFLFF